MASLAVSEPKRLVMPRSSSFIGPMPGLSLRLARGGDLDLAADDVLLDRVELALHVAGDLAVELVEGREPGPVVVQRADVVALGEAPRGRLGGVLVHRGGDALGHAGE